VICVSKLILIGDPYKLHCNNIAKQSMLTFNNVVLWNSWSISSSYVIVFRVYYVRLDFNAQPVAVKDCMPDCDHLCYFLSMTVIFLYFSSALSIMTSFKWRLLPTVAGRQSMWLWLVHSLFILLYTAVFESLFMRRCFLDKISSSGEMSVHVKFLQPDMHYVYTE